MDEQEQQTGIVVIRCEYGVTKSAAPWDMVPQDVQTMIGKKQTSPAVANRMRQERWQLVSVVLVVPDKHETEMWFQK